MKKVMLAVLLGVLCAGAVPARAEISAGDQLASGYLGLTVPLQESGIRSDIDSGTELDWGDVGVGFGASYLYFVNEYLGIGGEVSGSAFSEAEYEESYWTGSYWHNGKIKTSMTAFNVMAAGRLNVNPQSRVRVYVPFGVGLTSAKGEIKVDEGPGTYTLDGTTTSLGWFAGVGVEADLKSNWVLGGEMRYTGFTFDKSEYGVGGLSGNENYSYLSVLFKVGYKF